MTPDEAAAFWEELQRALLQIQYLRRPPDWRGRRTGEWRITQTERRAIQAFHLLKGENYGALAKRFRRHRDRSGSCDLGATLSSVPCLLLGDRCRTHRR